jgi:hypothetical protein
MNDIAEIEKAIEKLPPQQVEELANWLDMHRIRRATRPAVENWLQRARGAARAGATTQSVMALTRDWNDPL